MAAMTSVVCKNKQCKKVFQARTADVKRGWGKFCCKSCKAIEQENRTGQYKSYCCNKTNAFIGKHRQESDEHEFHANWSNEDGGDDCGDFDWAYDDDNGVSYGN